VKARNIKWLLETFRQRERVHPLIVDGLIEIQDSLITSALSDMRTEAGLSDTKNSAIEFILRKKGVHVR
jgi:hypothetical protein